MVEEIKEYSQEFIVHFDVDEHRLTIDEFYQTAKTVQVLTDSFNKILFDSKPIIGVYVRPPRPGGIIEVLDFVVQHPIGSWLIAKYGASFLEGILKDLCGKDVKELGLALSQETRKFIHDFSSSIQHDYRNLKVSIPVGLELLKANIEMFLFLPPTYTYRGIFLQHKIPEAFEAKNKFYTMCAKNEKIKGVSFSKTHNFPIKQQDFLRHIQPEPILTDEIITKYELHEVTIVAPVNVQDSQVQWKTQDNHTNKKISFYMTDENFRKEFFSGLYPLKETKQDDEMLVYIEYITVIHPNGKKSERRNAIKVFRFNDRILGKVPDEIKVNTPNLTANPKQGQLFDLATLRKSTK